MSIFEKSRFEIWSGLQHPFKHSLADFAYSNPALPSVGSVESALNYLFAVIYPNTQPAVANQAALPAVGNTLNDYRIVADDGDGNSAGYRWEQREGEASPSWHKVMDVDWSSDSIMASFLDVTNDLYVVKNGRRDIDGSGTPLSGVFAGQTIYGGTAASENLTLRANSGDGTGPHTGYVQVDDNFRAAVHNTYDIGSSSFRFKDSYLAGSSIIGTLTAASGSITDSSGSISFGDENLSTTGNITGAVVTGTTSIRAVVGGQTITVVPGLITDTTGQVSFDNENLVTTGTFGSGIITVTDLGDTIILTPDNGSSQASIAVTQPALTFGAANLLTSGNINGAIGTFSEIAVDNISINGNTITTTAGDLVLSAFGGQKIDAQIALATLGITSTGTVTVTGQVNADNLRFDGNTISSTNTDGNIVLDPNGTGVISASASIVPDADNTLDIGSAVSRFNDLFIGGVIGDGTTSISQATLQSLRDINSGVASGNTLFWDGSKWVASTPDTEVNHPDISGLTTGDAGHTQFAMLAGRAGGQTVQGGTASGEDLVLESTAHATKGEVQTKDNLVPFTDASYSGSWSGTDLGSSSLHFRDLYTKGELKGARVENFTDATLPAASSQNIGRLAYATDTKKLYVDNGVSLQTAGVAKFVSDTVWDGIITLLNTDVSASIQDARNAAWQLRDNANNFEIMYVSILATSASNVRITTNVPLPSGSYRLIGLE
jgi:hypothetical protein